MSLSARIVSRAIWTMFEEFPGMVGVEHVSRRAWASATFVGERHRLRLSFAGPAAEAAADRFIADLDDHEFDLGDHFVADIAIVVDRRDGEAVELLAEILVMDENRR
ncbi:MAG: hypothetical protein KF780_12285 [Sphingomonas sp.]|nr:hypothetical protein [Sphingomonas sp.]